jgi:spore germination protein YaaH
MVFLKNNRVIIMLTLIVAAIFVAAVAGGCGKTPAPKPVPDKNVAPQDNKKNKSGQVGTPRLVIGYYENPWPGTPDTVGSLPSMKTFGKNLSAVAPFWYRATKDGELDSKYSKLAHDAAKSMNLKIYPLITNMRETPEAVDALLGDASVRTKTVNKIVELVKEKNYDGVNIDFEIVPTKHKDNLTAFMAELYPKMVAMNKTVIVSVFPQVDVAESVSGAYDYKNLAKNADYVQIMTYDKHWDTSVPGPIAPIGWYEDNIKYAIEKCGSADKIIVGLGAYGYNWKNNKGETVTYVDAITLAEKKGVGVMYDEKHQAPHFKYEGHEVWFENAQSTEAKLKIIQKYQPAGIAIWRLGQEQPEIWQAVNNNFPKGNVTPGAPKEKTAGAVSPTPFSPAPAQPAAPAGQAPNNPTPAADMNNPAAPAAP